MFKKILFTGFKHPKSKDSNIHSILRKNLLKQDQMSLLKQINGNTFV